MIWLLAGLTGWCGTGWLSWWIRHHFHGGSGNGGGGLQPGDWGPPGCIVCTRIYGVIGGIVAVALIGPHFANAGVVGTVVIAFIGGSFLGDLGSMVTNKFMKR